MFHNLFSWFSAGNIASVLGMFLGWTILVLPTIISSLRKQKRISTALLLNMLALVLLDISSWISGMGSSKALVIGIYVCFVIAWLLSAVFAIFVKSETPAEAIKEVKEEKGENE